MVGRISFDIHHKLRRCDCASTTTCTSSGSAARRTRRPRDKAGPFPATPVELVRVAVVARGRRAGGGEVRRSGAPQASTSLECTMSTLKGVHVGRALRRQIVGGGDPHTCHTRCRTVCTLTDSPRLASLAHGLTPPPPTRGPSLHIPPTTGDDWSTAREQH